MHQSNKCNVQYKHTCILKYRMFPKHLVALGVTKASEGSERILVVPLVLTSHLDEQEEELPRPRKLEGRN